jgi:hypothetical protein
MTLARWLDTRSPGAPPRLRARLHAALGPWARADAAGAPELCLKAAETLLSRLLTDSRDDRRGAIDLLAVDALVTYAFEAASEQPETLTARAEKTMARIARLASDGDA